MSTGQGLLEDRGTAAGVEPAPAGSVVVAVASAEDALPAVAWAAPVAAARGGGLELVHVHPRPPFQPGRQPQAWTAARLRARVAPDVPVRYRILEGDRRVVLPRVAERAGLLVVGARAHAGGPAAWPAHPSCALAVVPAGAGCGGPARAVLDGGTSDEDVVRLAAEVATQTQPSGGDDLDLDLGLDLDLVRIWDPVGCCDRGVDASSALDAHLARLRSHHPGARPGGWLLGPRDRAAQVAVALRGATEVVVGPRAPAADWFAVLRHSRATLLVTATGDVP